MRVVEVALYEIVDVVTVRHGIMAAAAYMLVPGVVAAARMRRRTTCGIRVGNLERVLVGVAFVHVMQMTVMQVVDVSIVLDFRMRTVRTVSVRMLAVNGVFH